MNGSDANKTETGSVNPGDLSGLSANGEALGSEASGTATADAGSPFGSAAGGGASGAGSGGGGADGSTTGAPGEDDGTGKKSFAGLFDIAKTALGNLFKKGPGDKNSSDDVNKNGLTGSGDPALDSKKWRPRGMVRGLASHTELAGKFEDIWKVMNKQYKIQDQKDAFIFGADRN